MPGILFECVVVGVAGPSFSHPGIVEWQDNQNMGTIACSQGLFFWKSGYVVRALSDDWYVVRIQGRAADEEASSADEHEL